MKTAFIGFLTTLMLLFQGCSKVKVALDMYCVGQDGVLIIDQALADKCCGATRVDCPQSPGGDIIKSYSGDKSGNVTITNSIAKNVGQLRQLLSASEILGATPKEVAEGPISQAATASGSTLSFAPTSEANLGAGPQDTEKTTRASGSLSSGGGSGGDLGLSDPESRSKPNDNSFHSRARNSSFGETAHGTLSGGVAGAKRSDGFGGGTGSAFESGGGGTSPTSTLAAAGYDAYGMSGSGSLHAGDPGPAHYFELLKRSESLFDVISSRYSEKQLHWTRESARQIKEAP